MKFLKAILILAVAASALSLGACASRQESTTTAGSTTSSTYSK